MKRQNALIETANRFLVRTTVILALFFVLSGVVTVRQRAEITKGTASFPVVSIVDNDREIGLKLGSGTVTVKKQTAKELESYIKRIKTLIERYG